MSSVIVLGLAAVWAVVLVPMWLRGHDRTNPTSSVERFSGAMRVLSRRQGAPAGNGVDRRWVVMPARAADGMVAVATVSGGGPLRPARSARPQAARPQSAPSVGVSRQVRRRRRTLSVLVGLCLVTGVLGVVLGMTWLWVQLAADLVLVAGLVRNRSLVREDKRRRMAKVARARRTEALRAQLDDVRHVSFPVARPATHPGARPTPWPEPAEPERVAVSRPLAATGTTGGPAANPASTPAAAAPPRRRAQQPAVQQQSVRPRPTPQGTPPQGRPLPPEPQNVTPRTSQPPQRVLDLTRPGVWSEGRLLDDPADVDPEFVEVEESDLEVILGRRRAVNG